MNDALMFVSQRLRDSGVTPGQIAGGYVPEASPPFVEFRVLVRTCEEFMIASGYLLVDPEASERSAGEGVEYIARGALDVPSCDARLTVRHMCWPWSACATKWAV